MAILFATRDDGSKHALSLPDAIADGKTQILPAGATRSFTLEGFFEDRATFEPRATLLRRIIHRRHGVRLSVIIDGRSRHLEILRGEGSIFPEA